MLAYSRAVMAVENYRYMLVLANKPLLKLQAYYQWLLH